MIKGAGRSDKQQLLNQNAKIIWLTGLSGSGKTSIALEAAKRLLEKGNLTEVLDGDNVRMGLNKDLGFSEGDRSENIRRIAETAKLFLDCGIICFCCFVSPTAQLRTMAKQIIGADDFIEVFINTPIEECEKRDVKGLYAKARKGEIADFTGVNAPFEAPLDAELEIKTENKTLDESVEELLNYLRALD